ncbi:MlaE family ABC transporter permease [Sulfuricystis thermophila]|uniref:MlaE family ABC transporter permease n=1 Tax=Sulfuricystis thermophila TaxID=2496847 RepID=UPI0024DF3BA1|nr:ABC transporter permease [Sulfuricystis thermophila]
MPDAPMNPAGFALRRADDAVEEIVLDGPWVLRAIIAAGHDWQVRLREVAVRPGLRWNCLGLEALDSAGAVLLWQLWGRRLPASLLIAPEYREIFARLDRLPVQGGARRQTLSDGLVMFGLAILALLGHLRDFIVLLGQLMLDTLHLLRHPGDLPRREISANIYKTGVRAMPVTALVGFLIGVVLSYLSALQLRQLGADMFIVNILGFGIIRELGPLLVAVLVAGRSGSAMTAQLGVMRVTEEIDALVALGVPRNLRLVFPKVVALAITLPLLVIWTSGIALLGGMVAANVQLDIGYGFFFDALPKAVPVANLWIGLIKGFAFGVAIALVACHFGLRVQPNTESLSFNTTASVVSAITLVILIDAIFAIITRNIGMPL